MSQLPKNVGKKSGVSNKNNVCSYDTVGYYNSTNSFVLCFHYFRTKEVALDIACTPDESPCVPLTRLPCTEKSPSEDTE